MSHETTPRPSPETSDVVVLDMSALRLTLDRARAAVTVANGIEVVAVIPLDELTGDGGIGTEEDQRREMVFQALDRTLATGRLSRVGTAGLVERLPVALYNPYTAEVASGPVPTTRAFSAGVPLAIPSDGLICRLAADSLVWADGTRLHEQDRTFAQMTRVFAAHAA